MEGNQERWGELCAQVEKEQDLEKLLELMEELHHLMDEKQNRPGAMPGQDSPPPGSP
jgi:hypothetical protein